MRISTAYQYQASLTAMLNQQAAQDRTQQQISSEKRIQSPSDDPIGSAQILRLSQSLASSQSYLNNIASAGYSLASENTVLGAASDLIEEAKGVAASARGATPTTQERVNYADYLTNLMQSLVGYANEKDSDGNYIFSGSKGGTTPYTFSSVVDNTTTPATNTVTTAYNGDSVQRSAQVSQGVTIPVSDPGDSVFGTVPNDVFTAINGLIKDLSATGSLTGSAFATQMDTALTKLTTALSTIQTVNAQVGARNQEVTNIKTTVTAMHTQYANEISRIDAVDLNEAGVTLKLQQTILQATQQTFVSTSKLSLFNYL